MSAHFWTQKKMRPFFRLKYQNFLGFWHRQLLAQSETLPTSFSRYPTFTKSYLKYGQAGTEGSRLMLLLGPGKTRISQKLH